MKVREIFRPEILTVALDETLVEAAARMDLNEVGALAVLREGELIGIITERDLTRALADGADPQAASVEDYMTDRPVTVSPSTDVAEATATMLDVGARHLPVVDGDKVVGMVSARDLLGGEVRRGAHGPGD